MVFRYKNQIKGRVRFGTVNQEQTVNPLLLLKERKLGTYQVFMSSCYSAPKQTKSLQLAV
jgi:hypothetical protein